LVKEKQYFFKNKGLQNKKLVRLDY
jgi:hypothetical protein